MTSITPGVAKRRPAVWVTSRGEWGELIFVRPFTQRCKVRLVSGRHVWVPANAVEVHGS